MTPPPRKPQPPPPKQPRKRKKVRRKGDVPLWMTRRFLKRALLCCIVGGFFVWIAKDGGIAKIQQGFYRFTAAHHLALEEIKMEGRTRTTQNDVVNALGISLGQSLFAFDATAAQEKLLALPWIKEARVQRQFPNRIQLFLTERTPVAIWQNQGEFFVIDSFGTKIESIAAADFPQFIIVVGDQAPKNSFSLINILKDFPQVEKQVVSAAFVGNRRWNLYLKSGIEVRLPDQDPLTALKTLDTANRQYGLLRKNIERIDLRLADRMLVKQKDTSNTLTNPPNVKTKK